MSKPTLVGITGTIGSGKSLVGKILTKQNFLVIDTDDVVHRLFSSDISMQKAIQDRFGSSILSDNESIDRAKLGAIVFDDIEARKDLEAIVHPSVITQCAHLVALNAEKATIFFLVPLLFEANLQKHYDEIWTVITDENILKERLRERTKLPASELDKRIAAQFSQQQKAALSDRVIDNSGTAEQTEAEVAAALSKSGLA